MCGSWTSSCSCSSSSRCSSALCMLDVGSQAPAPCSRAVPWGLLCKEGTRPLRHFLRAASLTSIVSIFWGAPPAWRWELSVWGAGSCPNRGRRWRPGRGSGQQPRHRARTRAVRHGREQAASEDAGDGGEIRQVHGTGHLRGWRSTGGRGPTTMAPGMAGQAGKVSA